MRVAIAGAGAVGRSLARELMVSGHSVLLIDRDPRKITPHRIEGAEWLLADACEVSTLEEAHLQEYDVVISCTGDDKVNLVVSLLAKTEFGTKRVVARINHPANEWLFTEAWGVDVAVSTPRVIAALVEEAVSVGDVVRLFSLQRGEANLIEITVPDGCGAAGRMVRDLKLPRDATLVTIIRGHRVITPAPDEPIEAGDELMFVAIAESEQDVRAAIWG